MNKINFLTKPMSSTVNNKITSIEQYIKNNVNIIKYNINENIEYKTLIEDKDIKKIYNFVIKNKNLIGTLFVPTNNIKSTTCINQISEFKYNEDEIKSNESSKRESIDILHNMTELVIRMLLMITQNKKYKKWKNDDNHYLEIYND